MRVPSAEQRNSLAALVREYHDQIAEGGAEAYLTDRGITRRAIDRFLLGYTGDTGDIKTANRLSIPYLTGRGPWQVKYRCLEQHDGTCKENRHGKYIYDDGAEQHLYNAETLLTTDRVVVVEGELDAIAVELTGAACVGYPGADTWRKSRHFRWCFDSVDEVIVVADGDPPEKNPKNRDKSPGDPGWTEAGVGEEAAKVVADSLRTALPDLTVRVCVMPTGHDSNSYINESGALDYLETIGWFN